MMEKNEARDLATALTKRLANFEVSDDDVRSLAESAIKLKARPTSIDICQYGFCIDYLVPTARLAEVMTGLAAQSGIRRIGVFPHGIIDPEAFRVNVEHFVRLG
ncbi:MAG: hypothetical protein RIT81_15675 [Deltaproteobacteria bacterium]